MYERFYKPDSNFVLVRITQDIDDSQLRQHVLSYNRETSHRKGLLELIDGRGVTDTHKLTVTGCIDCVSLEKESPRVIGGKVVLLVSNPFNYGMAREYAAIAEAVREVEVFYNLEEAVQWLGVKETLKDIEYFIKKANGVRP